MGERTVENATVIGTRVEKSSAETVAGVGKMKHTHNK
jgi:hypothetical protein